MIIVQFVKIVQLVQLDYYGYIKFFGVFVGTWVGAFTEYLPSKVHYIFVAQSPTLSYQPPIFYRQSPTFLLQSPAFGNQSTTY